MAQQAMTTQVACSGRFTLGIGPSHHWIIKDQLGLPYDRPALLVRDYLDVLDAAFAGPGPMAVDNDTFRVHSPVDVTDAFEMRVLVAALGPTMLRIAGERTGDRRLRRPPHHRRGDRGRTRRNPCRGRSSRRALLGR
jgi:alkanesulfonate monooxygenase SsuD/methylene tetrahydromethanopterin reductase-like flavin-dependent oxidoreductase (luciferase family)